MLKLVAGAIAGMLFLFVALAAAIFLSAGTLDYWQAWLFLVVFFGCTLLITAYLFVKDKRLLEARVRGGPAAEKQKKQQAIQSLASLAFLGIFIAAGLDHRFGWSSIPAWLSVLAAALVAIGMFSVFLVFRENTFTSATIEVAEKQRVVDTGPYRLVRHPMYSGAGLLVLAAPIALGSWVSLVFSALLMGVVVARLLDEEQFLARELQGYEEYRRKVKYRLIPGVW
jgi:protein-S-isoprenylcysteine O-methyltransferase Ste14